MTTPCQSWASADSALLEDEYSCSERMMEVDDVMKLSLVWVGVDVRVCGNEGVCRGMCGSVWVWVGVGLWVMGVCV